MVDAQRHRVLFSIFRAFWLVAAILRIGPVCMAEEAGPLPGNVLIDVRAVPDSLGALYTVKCFDSEYTFCIDTGANVTGIDTALEANLGDAITRAIVTTASRDVGFDVFKGPSLELGGFRLQGKHAVCVDLRLISQELGHNLGGVIGLDTLSKHVVEMDFAGERIRFFREVPEETRRNDERLRMGLSDAGMLQVSGLLPDGTDKFVLDTGSDAAVVLSQARFAKLKKAKSIQRSSRGKYYSIVGKETANTGVLATFRLGTHEHQELLVGTGRFSALGRSYLRRYVATFDFRLGHLYLRPSRDYDAGDARQNRSGLYVQARGSQLTVDRVENGSPAFEAGLRTADRILRVHGRNAEDLPERRIQAILSRDGEAVEIVASRDEKDFVCKFNLRNLAVRTKNGNTASRSPTDSSPR